MKSRPIRAMLVGIGLAAAFPLAAWSQTIRIFTEDELPSTSEILEILATEVDAEERAKRGLRVIDVAPERRSARPRSATATAGAKRPNTIAMPLRFMFNSETLAADALARLDVIAAAIKALPLERSVVIEGHTDAHGSTQFNYELSLKRAEAVRAYLVREHGIAAGKLVAVGKGESTPLVKANPYAPENRRVQFRAG